jgi:hypothetical protein
MDHHIAQENDIVFFTHDAALNLNPIRPVFRAKYSAMLENQAPLNSSSSRQGVIPLSSSDLSLSPIL